MLTIQVVVACRDASGAPTFYPCLVVVSDQGYEEGKHYDEAIEEAEAAGYEDCCLAYDENDGPDFLFENLFN